MNCDIFRVSFIKFGSLKSRLYIYICSKVLDLKCFSIRNKVAIV